MASRRHDETPVEELSDRQLRNALKKANQTIAAIDRLTPAEVVRSGQAETLARYEAAVTTAEDAGEELRQRRHRSLPDRLRLDKALRDAKHEPHPAVRWLEAARRFSAPELQGETLVADRLSEDDAAELETLVKRKREIVDDEHAEPLTADETATWERLLGMAAGDENLFERKRKEAAEKTKLGELKDERKVASLPRQPLLAEPGASSCPVRRPSWLVGDEARARAWTLQTSGCSSALLGAFANDDPSVFVGGRFEGEGDDRCARCARRRRQRHEDARPDRRVSAGGRLRVRPRQGRRSPCSSATDGSRSSRRSPRCGSGSVSGHRISTLSRASECGAASEWHAWRTLTTMCAIVYFAPYITKGRAKCGGCLFSQQASLLVL